MEVRYDARGIANLILDRADVAGLSITNMAINKIVYFAHAWFLIAFERQLILQSFEAWQHGPIVQDIYHSFKKFGEKPISGRATRLDRSTARPILCESNLTENELALIGQVAEYYCPIPAGKLRGMTHVAGGPWDMVWNYEGASNPGMVIPDSLIRSFYKEKFLPIGETNAYPKGAQSSAFRTFRQ